MSEVRDSFILASKIINPIILGIMISINCFIFYKLKFRIDFSGLVTLILYFIAQVFRVVSVYERYNSDDKYSFLLPCQILVWISLYYFTFEIADIKITISE